MTTAASGVSPHGVWCCPTGLTWAAAASACTGTITEGVFMSSPAHCSESYDVYTFGPGSSRNTQGFVTEYTTPGTGTPSAATLQPASDIALTVQASGVFLQGQTMPTPTPSSAVDLSMEEVIHNQATVIHHPELVRRATPTTYPTIAPVSPGAIGGAIAGGVLGTAVLVGFGFIIRKKTRERVRAAREAAAAEAAKTGSTNGNANGSASANGSRRNSRTRIRASIRTIKTTPTPTITITEDDQPQQQQETQQMQTQYLYPDLESGDESAGSGTVTPKSEKDGLGGGGGGGVGVGERGGVPGAYVRRKAELEARLGVIPELEALPWSAMREEAITHSLPPSPGPSGRPRPTRRITG
ncbi:hypothetical protein M426DRAFT_321064 [Hypoxylon sp. CI-4A]|nr:hypothetical protein M426DRAFT_321064 [Hypoxylon sp. CI-4A]